MRHMFLTTLILALAAAGPALAQQVGEVGVDWLGNDIIVEAVKDPEVEGVTCHVSYFERNAEAIYTEIGKFCAIAANTRINALEHPIERITQHKVSYRPNEYFRWLGVDAGFRAQRQGRRVRIGHDVWIGHGAVVLPGISIGNGAVIGANAVVTKDVDAYEIMAGVPARRLRQRFAPGISDRIQALTWWDWPAAKLADAIPDMQALPIEDFLARWSGD